MSDFQSITIRKVADRSEGRRVVAYDPETDTKYLVNPDTGEPQPWPLAGIRFEGDIPKQTQLSTKFVQRGRQEGWLAVEGERVVHRPGGPPSDPWRQTHTFVHVDSIIFKTLDGDVKYEVFGKRGQPDKYDSNDKVVESDGTDPSHEVEWFYSLRLVK